MKKVFTIVALAIAMSGVLASAAEKTGNAKECACPKGEQSCKIDGLFCSKIPEQKSRQTVAAATIGKCASDKKCREGEGYDKAREACEADEAFVMVNGKDKEPDKYIIGPWMKNCMKYLKMGKDEKAEAEKPAEKKAEEKAAEEKPADENAEAAKPACGEKIVRHRCMEGGKEVFYEKPGFCPDGTLTAKVVRDAVKSLEYDGVETSDTTNGEMTRVSFVFKKKCEDPFVGAINRLGAPPYKPSISFQSVSAADTPLYNKWWFWTITGVAVVAAIIIPVLVVKEPFTDHTTINRPVPVEVSGGKGVGATP